MQCGMTTHTSLHALAEPALRVLAVKAVLGLPVLQTRQQMLPKAWL